MGVKGYRGTMDLVSSLFEEKNYKAFFLSLLNGLDLLETPVPPQKYEVDSLRLAWIKMQDNRAFETTKDKTAFFTFLNLGSNEMDACMFGKMERPGEKSTHVWLDLEVKTAQRGGEKSEIEAKLIDQVQTHAKEVMPMFFQDIMCVSAGFLDGVFVSAQTYHSGLDRCLSENEFYSFMREVVWSDDGMEYIRQITGIGNIRGIIRQIEDGTFKWHVDTRKKLDAIDNLLSQKRFVLCYAEAGSGKSVLATSLFMRHKNDPCPAKMLVMNQKFYKVLSMDKFYADKGCFFGSNQFLAALTADSIAIIDEAQRVNSYYLIEVLKRAKCLIAFGDERQSFYHTDNLDAPKDIAAKIESQIGVKAQHMSVRCPKRYDDFVALALESLTKIDAKPQCNRSSFNNYSIRVIRNFDEFIDAYNKDNSPRMFIPYGDRGAFSSDPLIKKAGLQLLDADTNDFYVGKQYVGDTFHAISFDVDNNYVYLPNLTLGLLYRKHVLTEERLITTNDKKRFLNELNILFTRGLKSLTIYVPDVPAYLHIMSVLKGFGIV